MRKAYALVLSPCLLLTASCTTLNDSIKLGGTIGSLGGAAAVHAAYSDAGAKPDTNQVLTGAAVGIAVGLITSYITHKEVEQRRYTPTEEPEAYFGDLPPNPFIVPKQSKKGGH